MKRCGVCRNPYRGKATRVVTVEGRKLACPSCTARGFTVVPIGGVSSCKCGAPATTCGSCAAGQVPKDRAKLVAEATAALEAKLKVMTATAPVKRIGGDDADAQAFGEGMQSGIQVAIDTLKGGRW